MKFKTFLKHGVQNPEVEIIISTGGTGLTGRDVSPEAFREIFDKEIEGFGELFRYLSFKKIGTSTIQSRAIAGLQMEHTFLFYQVVLLHVKMHGMKFLFIN